MRATWAAGAKQAGVERGRGRGAGKLGYGARRTAIGGGVSWAVRPRVLGREGWAGALGWTEARPRSRVGLLVLGCWAEFAYSISIPLSFLFLIQTKFEFKYKFEFKPHSIN